MADLLADERAQGFEALLQGLPSVAACGCRMDGTDSLIGAAATGSGWPPVGSCISFTRCAKASSESSGPFAHPREEVGPRLAAIDGCLANPFELVAVE